MISLELAKQLKKAGLVWRADLHHFFAIPDRGFDDRAFVISDMMAQLELMKGWPVVTFQGGVEWALDYILTKEVIWMPTEAELRQEIEDVLFGEEELFLQLTLQHAGYQCEIFYQGEHRKFTAVSAIDAYGHALLYILQTYTE